MVTITTTVAPVTVGPATLNGRVWSFPPLFPWSGDVTAEATTYNSRNASKTTTVNTFLGVKFAEPPVGALRYKPAVDYDYPAGSYDLSTWPDVPIQTFTLEDGVDGRPEWGVLNGAYNWPGYGVSESEDCLRLNIWQPVGTPPSGGWPVVVWWHGGGWGNNSAISYQQRGHRLATKGVIVVCPEYRLSNFGHFFHPDYEAEVDWNGPNFAYSDMASALRWVNRNIASFSGNAAKVCIGGTSAGGAGVLGMLEDTTLTGLFSSAWVSSGGGLAKRIKRDRTPSNKGYAARYDWFARAVTHAAPYLTDYANTNRTVEDAIAANSVSWAIRNALSPAHIQALSDGYDRITRASLAAGVPASVYTSTANVYPFHGGDLTYDSAVDAAVGGAFSVPAVISSSENEASVVNLANIDPTAVVRNLNVFDQYEWQQSGWFSGGWSDTEQRRLIYSHAVFQYPAWRIAKAMEANAGTAYLMLINANGANSGYANHSTDVSLLFGNVEWTVSMSGAEAKVTAYSLLLAEGMMQALANMADSGDPGALYSASTDFDLFATDPSFSFTAYESANPYHWNVIGNTSGDAASAPVTNTYGAWNSAAWTYYFARLG